MASEDSEPALLHTWASAEKPYLKERSSATVYFQTDKHSNIRDLIRRCITRTSQVAMAEPGSLAGAGGEERGLVEEAEGCVLP